MPLLISQKNAQFSFKDSRFKMEKYKESSARIVVFREFSVLNSFTLEGSFLNVIKTKRLIKVPNEKEEE